MARHEQQPRTPGETLTPLDQREIDAAKERLDEQREKQAEQDKQHEVSPDTARKEALEQANTAERVEKSERVVHEKTADRHQPFGKKHKEASFQRTMSTVQSQLNGPSRTFSKVIHNKVVERTSEAVGATIARPNAVLAGSMMAFVATLAVFLIAKRYGYQLSGFETIAAFIGGWCLGILFDFFRVMITGKRS